MSRVVWSDQLNEWVIVTRGIGRRHFFDCKAEAEEHLRLAIKHGQDAYVWRILGQWVKTHQYNEHCSPHWKREQQ